MAGERQACMQLLSTMRERYSNSLDDARAVLALGDAVCDEKLDPADHAAWTQLAITVLASDVAITLF